jgi:hypothetical protein
MGFVTWLLFALLVYSGLGVCVGVAFVLRGVNAVDPAAVHASIPVRILLLPGAAALWPLMLRRWIIARRADP